MVSLYNFVTFISKPLAYYLKPKYQSNVFTVHLLKSNKSNQPENFTLQTFIKTTIQSNKLVTGWLWKKMIKTFFIYQSVKKRKIEKFGLSIELKSTRVKCVFVLCKEVLDDIEIKWPWNWNRKLAVIKFSTKQCYDQIYIIISPNAGIWQVNQKSGKSWVSIEGNTLFDIKIINSVKGI